MLNIASSPGHSHDVFNVASKMWDSWPGGKASAYSHLSVCLEGCSGRECVLGV